MANTISSSQLEQQKQETDNEHDSETTSQISATLLDISNLVNIVFILKICWDHNRFLANKSLKN